jgi:RNA polymerase sigma-70 factor (ECF subfamily)
MQTLEELWESTSAKLKRYILSRVEDEATAEDLLQEVFVRIHLNMANIKESEHFQSWIYQIARNVIIDHYRARRPQSELSESLRDPQELFAEPDAADEIASSMRELVATLPDPYREALLLTEFEGISQQALAERLGISISGAKSRVQRARQKIKDSLLTCCHFEFDRYGRVIDYWDRCCCCTEKLGANASNN